MGSSRKRYSASHCFFAYFRTGHPILEKFPLLNRKSLEFEILESSALQDINIASEVIKDCTRLGIAFSIDDFGTGYS
jgi:EAL domain-containing protein (putative c-di-GMP-specific phosphodiesterase class I)